MAYPPPPGTSSLPARPPVSAHSRSSFKPAFSSVNQSVASSSSSSSYVSAAPPRSSGPSYPGAPPATAHYGPSYSSYPNHAPPAMNSSTPTYSYSQQQSYRTQSYSQSAQYSAAPQIRNPFPTPGGGASDFDPEMAAQIAQWQSTYVPRETDKDGKPTAGADYPKLGVPEATGQLEKKKTVVREGGGKKWTDESLLEWDPSHLRLFVGNLAGETTDESLLKAFSRWKSVQKARVIRDKRTTKSKGFGFVSFSDADDFFQAAKEMNGKYIQSHPVVVKKATTEIKVTNVKDKDRNGKKNNKKKGGNQNGSSYEPNLGPVAGNGITKPGQKTKNGLRLLG